MLRLRSILLHCSLYSSTTPRFLHSSPNRKCAPHLLGYAPTASPSHFQLSFRRTLILQTPPDLVRIARHSDSDSGIVNLKLERSEAKNAISKGMLSGLQNAILEIDRDPLVKVVLERRLMNHSEAEHFVNSLRSTFSSLEALSVPTIAVIEGAALGGGLEMALSCDLRICGEDAKFSLPETGFAIIPGAGGTQRLPRLVGRSLAKELIYTARRIGGSEALSIGLVNYCVPAGNAYNKALEIAREINEKGPLAIRMAKRAIDEGMLQPDLSSAMSVEEECYEKLLHSQDRLEGLAAFVEKRRPRYSGK